MVMQVGRKVVLVGAAGVWGVGDGFFFWYRDGGRGGGGGWVWGFLRAF